jgi:hypothetical protein
MQELGLTPQALIAFTHNTPPLNEPVAQTVIEFDVDDPVMPGGSDHSYEVAFGSRATVKTTPHILEQSPPGPVINPGDAGTEPVTMTLAFAVPVHP